jgi:hypothetical protein
MSIPIKSIVAGPAGTAPAATQTQSGVIDGGTRKVADRYNPGRYLVQAVIALGADTVTAPSYYAY